MCINVYYSTWKAKITNSNQSHNPIKNAKLIVGQTRTPGNTKGRIRSQNHVIGSVCYVLREHKYDKILLHQGSSREYTCTLHATVARLPVVNCCQVPTHVSAEDFCFRPRHWSIIISITEGIVSNTTLQLCIHTGQTA